MNFCSFQYVARNLRLFHSDAHIAVHYYNRALTYCPLIIFTTGSLDSLHSSPPLQNNPFRAECHSAHKAGITSTSYPTNRHRSLSPPTVNCALFTWTILSADCLEKHDSYVQLDMFPLICFNVFECIYKCPFETN